jgi:hypothetical protein
MDIRYGLISADSHVVTDKNAFVERMAKSKWGERIPQIVQVDRKGQTVDRWAVYGMPLRGRGVCNCPAVMGDPLRNNYPQRWEDVPAKAYVPAERLKALDADGIDGEVLFPTIPVPSINITIRNSSLAACKPTMIRWPSGARPAIVLFR